MVMSLLLCSLHVGNPLLSTWMRGSTMRPSLPQSVLVSSFSNSSLHIGRVSANELSIVAVAVSEIPVHLDQPSSVSILHVGLINC